MAPESAGDKGMERDINSTKVLPQIFPSGPTDPFPLPAASTMPYVASETLGLIDLSLSSPSSS